MKTQIRKAKLIQDKKGNWRIEIYTLNRIVFGKNKKRAQQFLQDWKSANQE